MNKAVLYVVAAVIAGVAMMLFPLFTLTTVTPSKVQNEYSVPDALSEGIRGSEEFTLTATEYPVSALEIFTVGLIAALLAYLVSKLRMPH